MNSIIDIVNQVIETRRNDHLQELTDTIVETATLFKKAKSMGYMKNRYFTKTLRQKYKELGVSICSSYKRQEAANCAMEKTISKYK